MTEFCSTHSQADERIVLCISDDSTPHPGCQEVDSTSVTLTLPANGKALICCRCNTVIPPNGVIDD